MQQPVQRQTLRNKHYLLACFCWPGLLVFLDSIAVHLHHRWPTAARGEEAAAEEVLALGAAHPHPPYWYSPISDRPHRHTDYYSEARMDATFDAGEEGYVHANFLSVRACAHSVLLASSVPALANIFSFCQVFT